MVIVLSSLGLSACSPDYETKFETKILFVKYKDLSQVRFKLDGGSKDIPIETNVDFENWSAVSNANWINVEKEFNNVKLSAGHNDQFRTRTGKVTIAYGHQSYEITVTQAGIAPVLLIDGEREGVVKEANADGGIFTVEVESNLDIDFVNIPDYADWLEYASVEGDDDKKILTFNVAPNYYVSPREVEIILQSLDNFNHLSSFVVKQEERDWGLLVPEEIDLRLDMIATNAQEPSEGPIASLIDRNISTFFHTLWSRPSPGGKPHYLQIDLDDPISFVAFEYIGRAGGGQAGDVKRAGVWVSSTGNDVDAEWTKVSTITYELDVPKNEKVPMNEQVVYLMGEYKYIRFIPEARRSADPIDPSGTQGWWNMSEIYMYKFDL